MVSRWYSSSVVGIPGDRIQVARDCLDVNGAVILDSERKELDSLGLPLEHTAESEIVLTEGRFFVTETNRREAGTAAISARSPRIKSAPAGGPCGRLEALGNVTLAPVSSGARAGCGDGKIQLEPCSRGCVPS